MRKYRLLLVEDNEGDILLTKELLDDHPFVEKIDVVRNGKDAIDFIFKRNGFENCSTPEIILLDINLPLKNGHQVLQALKDHNSTRDIPVIMFTTSSFQKDIISSYQEQASCYIVKPEEESQNIQFLETFEKFCKNLSENFA